MATEEAWRSRGIGSAVLAAVLDHVAERGGRVLWCNARLGAVAFYERAGFRRVGEEWDEPYIGPHVGMQLALPRP
jgi:ribosomal protein S18 acetylase RimI-like enzyme